MSSFELSNFLIRKKNCWKYREKSSCCYVNKDCRDEREAVSCARVPSRDWRFGLDIEF